jgi:hypothetical protein
VLTDNTIDFFAPYFGVDEMHRHKYLVAISSIIVSMAFVVKRGEQKLGEAIRLVKFELIDSNSLKAIQGPTVAALLATIDLAFADRLAFGSLSNEFESRSHFSRPRAFKFLGSDIDHYDDGTRCDQQHRCLGGTLRIVARECRSPRLAFDQSTALSTQKSVERDSLIAQAQNCGSLVERLHRPPPTAPR